MRNLRYFTFERNKYFYGKLLSVDDLESEQRYMNDKRRIINRFVHGTGVVCGMNVVPVDDITISVEMGLALDFAGREIMIEHPVTKKLSMIDGFEEYTETDVENSYLYLCVEYDEKEKEPVHSITGSKAGNEQKTEYNKYEEGYHLYLTAQEPENEELFGSALYEETKTIYWQNGVRIKQTVPKYVRGNHEFELKISVENLGQQNPISFHYDLGLTCIQGEDVVSISFDETEFSKAKRYEVTRKFKTNAVSGADARLAVVEGSFKLEIGKIPMRAEAMGTSAVHIISGNVKQELMDRYYRGAMEEIVKNTYQQSIYLARISVIRAGEIYVIDGVESMPFDQYLYNNILAGAMNRLALTEEEYRGMPVQSVDREGGGKPEIADAAAGLKIATGSVVIDLGIGGDTGQKFFSEEIPHGLGLGVVHILLGEAYGLRENSSIVFGAPGIFEEKKRAIKVQLAAKVDVEKGMFRIGVCCLEPTSECKLKVHWTAVKDGQELLREKEEVIMQIKPDMLNLSIRDTYYFEAVIGQNAESRVKWSVREQDGGTIDKNGMYTAPNRAGVYEIIAESMDNPKQRASTLVVVRDV